MFLAVARSERTEGIPQAADVHVVDRLIGVRFVGQPGAAGGAVPGCPSLSSCGRSPLETDGKHAVSMLGGAAKGPRRHIGHDRPQPFGSQFGAFFLGSG